jgi:hypothetical protein
MGLAASVSISMVGMIDSITCSFIGGSTISLSAAPMPILMQRGRVVYQS